MSEHRSTHVAEVGPLRPRAPFRLLRSRWLWGAVLLIAFAAGIGALPWSRSLVAAMMDDVNPAGMRMTFSEEFDSLDVSAWGPGTRWIAHTPWNGDFGDARFIDPTSDFPFTVEDGILRIEARRDAEGNWQSGLLASADSKGEGFSQTYGYFEMRAKLPPGPGLWPAFWLSSIADPQATSSYEVDVLEHYGHFPDSFRSTIHVWFTDGRHDETSQVIQVPAGSLYEDFHDYGVLVRPDWTTFYLDRKEVWRVETPAEHQRPLLILLNLAMGSGWPIDESPDPSHMYVDYVRAYSQD